MVSPLDPTFQVDLRGLIDLLSQHLYSGPQVYIRELLQNGVDAITAAGHDDRERPGIKLIGADRSSDGRLHCLDSGIGLTPDEIVSFLATVGNSSKRDELGFRRSEMLGQFGIGLLSAFLVSDQIEVLSQTEDTPLVRWLGRSDGTWSHQILDAYPGDERGEWLAAGPGTVGSLYPRPGLAHWLDSSTVTRLARQYGKHLRPMIITSAPANDEFDWVQIAPEPFPWRRADRVTACEQYARTELGVEPLQVLTVAVPQAGLDGMVVIVGERTLAGHNSGHRVHLQGMLLSDQIAGLLPDWAFFARAAVNTTRLRPTASREGLYEDDLLDEVRAALGTQIRDWLLRVARTDPQRIGEFLRVHHLAVKSICLTDDELLAVFAPLLDFETNNGTLTLPELLETTDEIYLVETNDDFRQVAAVAAAQGLAVVNGGYTHDFDLVRRAPQVWPNARVQVLSPGQIEAHIQPVTEERLQASRAALTQLRESLDHLGVDVELRNFRPTTVPALYLSDAAARQALATEEIAAGADELWQGLLATLAEPAPARPRLLLNDASPLVRRLLGVHDPRLLTAAAESLYARAVLGAGRRLRPADLAAIDHSFLALLELALKDRND